MSDKEDIYDEKIAPTLYNLGQLCKDEGLSLFCVVEWETGYFGETTTLRDDASLPVKLAHRIVNNHGNIDDFLIYVLKYAEKQGHSSIFLNQLGLHAHTQNHVAGYKPCPFCGPSMIGLVFDDMARRWKVGCGRCGSSTGTTKTKEEAVKLWNTRNPAAIALEIG